MNSINVNNNMTNRFFNAAFPVVGGSTGALGAVLSNVTWLGIGEMVLQAAVFAFVGGVIGWLAKRLMDHLFKKEDK